MWWASELVQTLWVRNHLLLLPGIKPRFFSFPGHSLVVILTARSCLPFDCQWCVKNRFFPSIYQIWFMMEVPSWYKPWRAVCVSFFTVAPFYSVTPIFLNSDHFVCLQAAHGLPLFQFAISHGSGILVQFIAVNIVTVVCCFSFFGSTFWINKMCAHILNYGKCNTGKLIECFG